MRKHQDEDLDVDDSSVDVDVEVWADRRRPSWFVRNMATICFVTSAVGLIAALTFKIRCDLISARAGDLESLEARIDSLKAEQITRGVELELLRRSISRFQDELVIAQRQAQHAHCEADNAKLDAELIVEQVR